MDACVCGFLGGKRGVLTQRNPLSGGSLGADTLPLGRHDSRLPSQFNDDTLGRVLEDLADHGPALLTTLGTGMQAVEHAGGTFLQPDTGAGDQRPPKVNESPSE